MISRGSWAISQLFDCFQGQQPAQSQVLTLEKSDDLTGGQGTAHIHTKLPQRGIYGSNKHFSLSLHRAGAGRQQELCWPLICCSAPLKCPWLDISSAMPAVLHPSCSLQRAGADNSVCSMIKSSSAVCFKLSQEREQCTELHHRLQKTPATVTAPLSTSFPELWG